MVIDGSGLRFTAYAWAKLQFMCYSVGTEISGMGISDLEDPLLIRDIAIIKQTVGIAHVDLDMDHYADTVMMLCDPDGEFKLKPHNCMRVWIHTHPRGICSPSTLDEETFHESFGEGDWAVMMILSKDGSSYARMRSTLASGICINNKLEISVDWSVPFPGSDHDSWSEEIRNLVNQVVYTTSRDVVEDDDTGIDGVVLADEVNYTPPPATTSLVPTAYPIAHSSPPSSHAVATTNIYDSSIRIEYPDGMYLMKSITSQYTRKILALSHISRSSMTYFIEKDLKEAGVILADRTSDPVEFLITKDANGHNLPDPVKADSKQLSFWGVQDYEKDGCNTEAIKRQLGFIEKELWGRISNRIDKNGNFLNRVDEYDNFITVIKPWRTVDNTCMWVSDGEYDMLDNVAKLIYTAREAIDEMRKVGHNDKKLTQLNSDVPGGGEHPYVDIMNDIYDTLLFGKSSKLNRDDVELILSNKCNKLGASVNSLPMRVAIEIARSVDFSPRNFRNNFLRNFTDLLSRAVGDDDDNYDDTGSESNPPPVIQAVTVKDVKASIMAVLEQFDSTSGSFSSFIEEELADAQLEFADFGLGEIFNHLVEIARTCQYDPKMFAESVGGVDMSQIDKDKAREKEKVFESIQEVNENLNNLI